jgi:hypothetical protein
MDDLDLGRDDIREFKNFFNLFNLMNSQFPITSQISCENKQKLAKNIPQALVKDLCTCCNRQTPASQPSQPTKAIFATNATDRPTFATD